MNPIANLVSQQSISIGTGTMLLNTLQGRQSFYSAFGSGVTTDVFYYFISNQSAIEWEVGIGHLSDSSTLVRDTVIDSSNGGLLVNFGPGTKDIVNDLPAQYLVPLSNPKYRLITAAGAATVTSADGIVEINKTVAASTVVSVNPATLTIGAPITIKDGKGDADVNNITIVPASGTFDGSGTYVLSAPYQAITFYSNGTNLRGIA